MVVCVVAVVVVVVVHARRYGRQQCVCVCAWECVLVIASIFFPPLLLSVALHCLVCACVCVCVLPTIQTQNTHTHTRTTHTRDDVVVVGVVYNSRSGLYGLCAHLHLYTHSFHHHHTPHHHYIGGGGCPPTTNVVCVCVCVRKRKEKEMAGTHCRENCCCVVWCVYVCMVCMSGWRRAEKILSALLPLLLLLLLLHSTTYSSSSFRSQC